MMEDIFNFSTTDLNDFENPIEMYKQGYRVGKKINGPLDYQSEIIDQYHKSNEKDKDVAIQLPTGAGKTLTGLIIGEYRRRKYNEKIVFVCLNNVLVKQVCDQANNMYGISAVQFTGSMKNYSPEAKTDYRQNKSIYITNYSSVFNNNSFFSDANTFIFDDVHSAENYISNPWTFQISDTVGDSDDDTSNTVLFQQLSEKLNSIGGGPSRFTSTDQENHVVDAMSVFSMNSHWSEIKDIINSGISHDSTLNYSWDNIKEHLEACQLYYDSHHIVIEPLFSPTLTLRHIKNANCKIYLSATFGETSQSLRNLGIEKLTYVKLPENKQPTGGRHYVLFPQLDDDNLDSQVQLISELLVMNKKMVILTKNNNEKKYFVDNLTDKSPNTRFFNIDEIEEFKKSSEGVIVLSNRFDGLDFEGDTAHLVIITDLSLATNIQEKFLVSKINARALFQEQILNRSIQALGRASRSENDYSVVVALGSEIQNELQSPRIRNRLPKNLQAELVTGIMISDNISKAENPVEALVNTVYRLCTKDRDAIEKTEQQISSAFSTLKQQSVDENDKLSSTAQLEIKFNYALWNEDYTNAFNIGKNIVNYLGGDELSGYRAFWSYMTSYAAAKLYWQSGHEEYKILAKTWFSKKTRASAQFTPWFGKVIPFLEDDVPAETISTQNKDLIVYMAANIESMAFKHNLAKFKNKFGVNLNAVLQKLKSRNGDLFEKGVEEIGNYLGFLSKNSSETTAPDPWWYIGPKTIMVSECKITNNPISATYVKQASGHKAWLQKKENLSADIEIITVVISNQEIIEPEGITFSDDMYFVDQNSLVDYVIKATNIIASKVQDIEEPMDELWYRSFEEALQIGECSPLDFLNLLQSRKLSTLNTNRNK